MQSNASPCLHAGEVSPAATAIASLALRLAQRAFSAAIETTAARVPLRQQRLRAAARAAWRTLSGDEQPLLCRWLALQQLAQPSVIELDRIDARLARRVKELGGTAGAPPEDRRVPAVRPALAVPAGFGSSLRTEPLQRGARRADLLAAG